jgi:hypothetical protein
VHEPVGTWLPISGLYLWTGSSAVKRVLYGNCWRSRVQILIEDITFLGAIILIWHLIWHLIGFQGESMWTPALVLTGLNQDSLNSMLPDGVYQDSRWSISGA